MIRAGALRRRCTAAVIGTVIVTGAGSWSGVQAAQRVAIAAHEATGSVDATFALPDRHTGRADLAVLRDGRLRALRGVDGAVRWSRAAPGTVEAMDAGDVDGDGIDDILLVAATSAPSRSGPVTEYTVTQTVTMVSGRTGTELWHRTDVAVADVSGAALPLSPLPVHLAGGASAFAERNVDSVSVLDDTTAHPIVLVVQRDWAAPSAKVVTPAGGAGAGHQQIEMRAILVDGARGTVRGTVVADAVDGDLHVDPVGDLDGDGRTDLVVHALPLDGSPPPPIGSQQAQLLGGVAYSGADGHPLWATTTCHTEPAVAACPSFGVAAGLDARGRGTDDVLLESGPLLTLVAGDTGAALWRYVPAATAMIALALQPGSLTGRRQGADAVAVSVDVCRPCGAGAAVHVTGIAGSSGMVLWDRDLDRADVRDVMPLAPDLRGSGTGDVVVTTQASVVVLDGRTGATLWRHPLAPDVQVEITPLRVVAGHGAMDIAATLRTAGGVRLEMWSGRDGTTRWSETSADGRDQETPFAAPLVAASPQVNLVVPLATPRAAICYGSGGRRLWVA